MLHAIDRQQLKGQGDANWAALKSREITQKMDDNLSSSRQAGLGTSVASCMQHTNGSHTHTAAYHFPVLNVTGGSLASDI